MVLQLIVFLYATARDITHDENATHHHSAEQQSVEPSQTLSSKDTVTQHDPPPDELSNSVQAREDLIDEEHLEQHPAWNFMQEDDSLNSRSASMQTPPNSPYARAGAQPLNSPQNRGPVTGQGLNSNPFGGPGMNTGLPGNPFGGQGMKQGLPGNPFGGQGMNSAPASANPTTKPFPLPQFGTAPGSNRPPNVLPNLNGMGNPFGTPMPNGSPNGLPSTLGQMVSQRRGGQINFCMPASLLPALLNQFLCILPTLLQPQPVTPPAPTPSPVYVPVPNPIQVPVPVPNPIQVPVPNPISSQPVTQPFQTRQAGLMSTPYSYSNMPNMAR